MITLADLPTDSDGTILPGVHDLNEPLVLGTPGQLTTLRLRGSGRALFGAATPGATILRANFVGQPAVKVIGARDSIIEELTIVGPYYSSLLWQPKGPNLNDWPEPAERRLPSSGIEVSGASSGVQIRNVDIAGFGVGLVTCPDGSDGQSEFITLDHCRVAFSTYGVSISHTQNRQLKIYATDFLDLHTVLTNNVHGKQSGFVDGLVSGHFNQVERICDVNQGYAGVVTFANCYGELVGMLGRFNDGSARMAVSTAFRDCYFRFTGTGLLTDGGSLLLDAGSMETPDLPTLGSACEIRGTRIRPLYYESAATFTQARKIVANLACGPIPRLTDWAKRPWLPQTSAHFDSTGQDLQVGYAGPQPGRVVKSYWKRDCVLVGNRLTFPLGSNPKPGDIVQDDQTLTTWFVETVPTPRVCILGKLNEPGTVSPTGSFVLATLATGPR